MNLDILNLYLFSFQFDIKKTKYIDIIFYTELEKKSKYNILDGFWQIQKHDFYLKKIYLFLHFGKYF
jgi:hypothetical protein